MNRSRRPGEGFGSLAVDAHASDEHATLWAKYIGLHRINNLIDLDTNKPFTRQDMEAYTHTLAPEDIRGTPEENEWSDELMQSWPALIGSIPQAVIDAATKATQVEEGMYVAFMPEDASPTYYARAEPDSTQLCAYTVT